MSSTSLASLTAEEACMFIEDRAPTDHPFTRTPGPATSAPKPCGPNANVTLLTLPMDVHYRIIDHLIRDKSIQDCGRDIASLGSTCRALRELANADQVWRYIVKRKHPATPPHLLPSNPPPGYYRTLLSGLGTTVLYRWGRTVHLPATSRLLTAPTPDPRQPVPEPPGPDTEANRMISEWTGSVGSYDLFPKPRLLQLGNDRRPIMHASAGAHCVYATAGGDKVQVWDMGLGTPKVDQTRTKAMRQGGRGKHWVAQMVAVHGRVLVLDTCGVVWQNKAEEDLEPGNDQWWRGQPMPFAPVEVGLEAGELVVLVAPGANHALALTSAGGLFIWYPRDKGVPVRIDSGPAKRGMNRIVHVSSGVDWFIGQCSNGDVWTCDTVALEWTFLSLFSSPKNTKVVTYAYDFAVLGAEPWPLLGRFPATSSAAPTRSIDLFHGLPPDSPCVDIAFGDHHATALDAEGRVWSWGCGSWGAHGRGEEQVLTPGRVWFVHPFNGSSEEGIGRVVSITATSAVVLGSAVRVTEAAGFIGQ